VFSILNETSILDDSCFTAVYQLKRLPWQSSRTRHFTVDALLRTEKLNLLNKQCFYRNSVRCQKLQQLFEVQSFGLDTSPQSFCYSFIALSITRCSKSAQKFAVRVRQVTTVAMATTQLVLNQFKNFSSHRLSIE